MRDQSERRALEMPLFDPGDAGVDAGVLFLLESPGPRSSAGKGSGIISVDNDDRTAANLWRLRHDAGLLQDAVHWNAVPWWLGTAETNVIAPSDSDRRRAVGLLRSLLPLLPELRAVVLMGNHAKSVWGQLLITRPNNLPVLPTWHPSGQGLAGTGKREDVLRALRSASLLVSRQDEVAHERTGTGKRLVDRVQPGRSKLPLPNRRWFSRYPHRRASQDSS